MERGTESRRREGKRREKKKERKKRNGNTIQRENGNR
jgi:hypothetical protein